MIRIIAPAAAMFAIIAVIAVASGRSPTSAQTDPVVSVDAISDAANTATTVGPIETCGVMFKNGIKDGDETDVDTIQVDVVIQAVTNIGGFQADLFYDPTVLEVTAANYNFLLASTGAAVLDLGNSTPDTDGDFFMAAAMYSPVIVIGADGDGVLARVTFEAVGSGSSPLDLASVKLSDADGNPIPPVDANNFYAGSVNDGSVAVDASCGAPTPTPTPTPGPGDCPDPGSVPWTTPPGDVDCDGFSTADENACGTDPDVACDDGAGLPDWPPDWDDSQTVNLLDLLPFKPHYGATDPLDPLYDARYDLYMDGAINLLDLLPFKPFFNLSCTP